MKGRQPGHAEWGETWVQWPKLSVGEVSSRDSPIAKILVILWFQATRRSSPDALTSPLNIIVERAHAMNEVKCSCLQEPPRWAPHMWDYTCR
jgi:hypothetical protein